MTIWIIDQIGETSQTPKILEIPCAMSAQTSERPPKDEDTRSTASSEDSDVSNEEGWEDVEPDDESQPIVGLFSDKIYPDVNAMLQEAKDKHDFDLRRIQKEFGGFF